MAEKLKIIPLGGLNEIGKNMTAYEYGGEIIVVDCGMAFPGEYVLLGNKREQVRMVGNAVTPNAARDLIAACVDSPGYTVRRHYDLVA